MLEREKVKVVTRATIVEALGVSPSTYGAFLSLVDRGGEACPIRYTAQKGTPPVVVYKLTEVDTFLSRACARYSAQVAAEIAAAAFEIPVR